MQALKQIQIQYPYARENLRTLDPELVIDMLLSHDAKLIQLGDFVRNMVTDKYGGKSERFEGPGQLLIFPSIKDADSTREDSESDVDEEKIKPSVKAKKAGHARNPQPAELPRVPVFAPTPDDATRPCPCCGVARVPVRQILQNSRYQFVPASFYFEDLYSVIYGCPGCDSAEEFVAKVPEPVERGLAAPGLLAQVAIARDFDHIPFNRQRTIYRRSGVNLRRSTLSDFYSHVASVLLVLYNHMHLILLQSKIISTDDTPVKVLDRSKAKKIKLGRQWIYLGDEQHPVNLFDYTVNRGRDGPLTFLKGFIGFLQGDCFSGNLAVCAAMGTTLVACLAHARRYFIKAMLNDKAGCNQALTMFQALFEIERTAKELSLPTEDIKLMREQEALPLLETFHTWLQKQYSIAQPKSSFGKALFYCLNNWAELTEYIKDGDLKITNNHSEQEMKYIAMGRKAWLFFGSDQGGKNHAIVMSVLSTCRRHGVEPWSYLTDVIQRLAEDPACNLDELLPYNWKQKYPTKNLAEITPLAAAPKIA